MTEDTQDQATKNPAAVELGRSGGRAGTGKAKARTREQAQKAVRARWDKWRRDKLIEQPPDPAP